MEVAQILLGMLAGVAITLFVDMVFISPAVRRSEQRIRDEVYGRRDPIAERIIEENYP